MERTTLLEMDHITKKFPGVLALNDVTFQVRKGDIHGLVGENGAGKSTLMKILSGHYPTGSYEGSIILNGKSLDLRSPNGALLQGIGVVPQEISVIPDLTVAENIVVGRWNGGKGPFVSLPQFTRRVETFLREHGMGLDPWQIVSKLTAAQKQEVMIARALYTNPGILILDEPTSSLSLTEINVLFKTLRDLRDQGVTSVFITHKLTEIFELTDHVTVLRDGTVAGEFARKDYNETSIIAAMVGRKIEHLYPVRTVPVSKQEVFRIEHLSIPHPTIANRNLVEDISLSLNKGEVLGIAGLVGSGRSEVLNAIYGRLAARKKVFVDGKEVRINETTDAKNAGIALVTEDRKLDGIIPELSIRPNITVNNLKLVSRSILLDPRKEKQVAGEYMQKLNVKAPSMETLMVNLSGGNQQKVVIGRVLLGSPKILLMDEPTKGVDVGAKNEIYNIMLDLATQGISIIMVSSELPELLAMCDRFVVLAGGKIRDEFTKEEASEHRVMLAATQANQPGRPNGNGTGEGASLTVA
jgi:ABC-type sugar transport system ATPase subunit